MTCYCLVSICVFSFMLYSVFMFFFFKQKTAYEMRISDWSSDVCSADQLREVFTQAQAVFNAPKILDPSAERPHLTTAVIGTRGGVGASTLATYLAWLMSAKGGRLTALHDLDVHFGTGALAIALEPGRGLTDAIENPTPTRQD